MTNRTTEPCEFGRPETSLDAADEAERRLARVVGLRGEVHRLRQRFGERHGTAELLAEARALLPRRGVDVAATVAGFVQEPQELGSVQWPQARSTPSCTRVASAAAFPSFSSAHHTSEIHRGALERAQCRLRAEPLVAAPVGSQASLPCGVSVNY